MNFDGLAKPNKNNRGRAGPNPLLLLHQEFANLFLDVLGILLLAVSLYFHRSNALNSFKSGVGRGWDGEKGFGMVWAAHASQESGGKGFRRAKTNHEKGFGCFMVPKSGVGMVWEGQK